jgi:RimJ/RimL family protein N-acetyltransferase
MSSPSQLRTARLLLRRWRESDHEPFAALNADPKVMEYLPDRLTRAESNHLIARIEARFAACGYGLWALEVRATGEFVGFTGLAVPSFDARFTPAVEVGWRLARSTWGKGYATEAGLASIAFWFRDAGLDEIVSFTSAANVPDFSCRSGSLTLALRTSERASTSPAHPRIVPSDRKPDAAWDARNSALPLK